MASAVALGHDGLRLRSRRNRSGRSHRLPWGFAVLAIVAASVVGLAGAKFATTRLVASTPVADAATLEQQRFARELRSIRAELQQSVASLGLAVTAYESGEIDRTELQRRLADVLRSYAVTSHEVGRLEPPSGEENVVAEYVASVNALTQSAAGLSRAYDDGDQAGVARSLAASLQAVAQLHDLSEPRV